MALHITNMKKKEKKRNALLLQGKKTSRARPNIRMGRPRRKVFFCFIYTTIPVTLAKKEMTDFSFLFFYVQNVWCLCFNTVTGFIWYNKVIILYRQAKKDVHFYTIAELKFGCTYVRIPERLLQIHDKATIRA